VYPSSPGEPACGITLPAMGRSQTSPGVIAPSIAPARRRTSERPSPFVHCSSSSRNPDCPAPDTDWYVETTMRSRPAARCSGAIAVTGTAVVQFGHDAMPFGMWRRSSGLISVTTSGTSGSRRNAAELSTTLAPAAAATGAHSAAM